MARVKILDVPNQRSSHQVATPKSGGVALVVAFLGAALMAAAVQPELAGAGWYWGFVGSALLVAGVAFYDDVTQKSFLFKFLSQMVAAAVVLLFGLVVERLAIPGVGVVELGWVSYPLTFLWLVGLTNAFNFMDGLDGLAGGVALLTAIFFGLLTFRQGGSFSFILAYGVAAGAAGFLRYNFPPAKIFMGDVGSAFVGFLFAALAVVAANREPGHISFLVMPMLLFHFIFDTAFTLWRRWRAGRNLLQAHREHLYQLFNQLGYSHRVVAISQYLMCLVQGAMAWVMLHIEGAARLWAFLPVLLLQVGYAGWVMTRARRAGLVGTNVGKMDERKE
ncbi:MraY family glycosyltransferase [Endothiovibrio diazotrophicus]